MPSDAPAWSLHSRLKEDTIDIGDLPLCRVLVIKAAHYPWLLLQPRRDGAVEIIDLDEVQQAQLMTEISRVALALKDVTRCAKLNSAEGALRALLSREEALKFRGNPGAIFLGLGGGAPVFGMVIAAAAAEKLLGRDDVAVTELRGMAMEGVVPPEQLSASAMARSI